MNLHCACNSPSNGQTTLEANNRFYNFSQINHASISSGQSADITIMTEEGDKVTLSSDTRIEASLTTYNSRALTNTTYTESRGKLVSFDANRQINITVEGDLNDKEKKEIKTVLKAVFKMIKKFLSGENDQLAGGIRKFTGLDTISNVEAEFEFKQSVTVLNRSSAEYEAYSATADSAEIAQSESEDSDDDIEYKDSDDDHNPVYRLTDRMLRRVKNSDIRPERFLKHAERMFAKRPRAFLKEVSADQAKMRLSQMIMSDFFQKLQKLAAGSGEPGLRNGDEAENAGSRINAAFAGEASVLQVNLLEKSDAFKLTYVADD